MQCTPCPSHGITWGVGVALFASCASIFWSWVNFRTGLVKGRLQERMDAETKPFDVDVCQSLLPHLEVLDNAVLEFEGFWTVKFPCGDNESKVRTEWVTRYLDETWAPAREKFVFSLQRASVNCGPSHQLSWDLWEDKIIQAANQIDPQQFGRPSCLHDIEVVRRSFSKSVLGITREVRLDLRNHEKKIRDAFRFKYKYIVWH